tara:strand:+ start:7715 stop:8842 length:1128 start_codon:yes stop_codon:yes gene_type:complete
MLPTNSNTVNTCDPISSNCVVWQGPDLTCVDVCQGDTISDIIAALCTQIVLLQATQTSGITFNIADINQTNLVGDAATNITELIQLMIDNIVINQGGGTGTGGGTSPAFGCSEVFKCVVTIPECFGTFMSVGGSLNDWITVVSNLLCTLSTSGGSTQAITSSLQQRVTNLEQAPKGEPTPRVYSSGVLVKNVLTPIDKIVQATDSQFIALRAATGTAANITTGINTQPANYQVPVSTAGYAKTLDTSVTTAGEAIQNLWVLVDDARRAIIDIQNTCCKSVQLTRMGGITSFYANNATCATALVNAGRNNAGDCTDIWNSSGVQFDPTCPAYTNPYDNGTTTELIQGRWYALCTTGPMATYSRTSPYWSTPVNTCG